MGATKGGAMAAILNAPEGSLEKALKEASEVGYVDVANYNSPAQVVITGDENAVKKPANCCLKLVQEELYLWLYLALFTLNLWKRQVMSLHHSFRIWIWKMLKFLYLQMLMRKQQC